MLFLRSAAAAAPGEESLQRVRQFADTLIADGRDRYGSVSTPMWVSMLDLKTRRIPKTKDPNWQRSYDAEDYMRNARGSNLHRDLFTVRTFYELSQLTGDQKYAAAADAYLRYFMGHCQSQATGLYAWGEHMFYNVVRDEIEATRHELERQLPAWEEMWRLDPNSVRREIEAIYRIHIWDKETFNFDRHGNYYTGQFDDLRVRGPYAKHSGLYAFSFYFLYTKTGEAKHLDWALKAGQLLWKVRHPRTGLVGGAYAPTQSGPTIMPPILAYYLLRTYQLDRHQSVFLEMAAAYVKSFAGDAYESSSGKFFRTVNTEDGSTAGAGYQSPWGSDQGETGFQAQACENLYRETKDPWFLDMARNYARFILSEPVPPTVRPETYGKNLEFLLDLYETTHEPEYLRAIRRYANFAGDTMFENGLIKESADGYIYNANSGAGELAHALLRLATVEPTAKLPAQASDYFLKYTGWQFARWQASTAVSPVEFRLENAETAQQISLDFQFDDGRTGRLNPVGKAPDGVIRFLVPAPGPGYCGTAQLTATTLSGTDVPWRAFSAPQTIFFTSIVPPDGEAVLLGDTPGRIERLPTSPLPPTEVLTNSFGKFYRVEVPTGAAGGLQIRYTADEAEPFLESRLEIARWNGHEWISLPTQRVAEGRTLHATVHAERSVWCQRDAAFEMAACNRRCAVDFACRRGLLRHRPASDRVEHGPN
ncbi:MAG: hypothetical protein V9H26_21390 [Verrucomicrobiota bacterium]